MKATLEALLDALPPDIGAMVRNALQPDTKWPDHALHLAFEAAGFPLGPIYPLASDLQPVHRLLAELPLHGVRPPARYALPPDAPTARRWLGIDPPGPCEQLVERGGKRLPLWRAVEEARVDHQAAGAVFRSLPIVEAARAFVALARSGYRFDAMAVFWYGNPGLLERLGPETAEWARATATEWLSFRSSGRVLYGDVIEVLLSAALARTGAVEDEHLDALLPLAGAKVFQERLAALPEARRIPAAMAAFSRQNLPGVVVEHALGLLNAGYDSLELVRLVLEKSAITDAPSKASVKKALAKLAKTMPAVKHALAEAKRNAPPAVDLDVVDVLKPKSESDLDALAREQVRLAGKAWDGEDLPVARRIGKEEEAFGGLLERRVLSERGGARRFDAWLYAGDSASYFVAGTTTEIGGMIQGSVELNEADPALRDALQEASAPKAKRVKKARRA